MGRLVAVHLSLCALTVREGSRSALGAILPVGRSLGAVCVDLVSVAVCDRAAAVSPPPAGCHGAMGPGEVVWVRGTDDAGVGECAVDEVWRAERRGVESSGAREWLGVVCAVFVGLVLGVLWEKFWSGQVSVRIEVKCLRGGRPGAKRAGEPSSRGARGRRAVPASTQTPRDPRVTKKRSDGTDSTPRSSDSSEVDRRLLGFPYWHRRYCVDLEEFEEVRERAMLDEDAWVEHRMSVAACITDRSPWSRYRVANCPSIGVCPWGRIAMESRYNVYSRGVSGAPSEHEGVRYEWRNARRGEEAGWYPVDESSPRERVSERGLTAWEQDALESYDASCEQNCECD